MSDDECTHDWKCWPSPTDAVERKCSTCGRKEKRIYVWQLCLPDGWEEAVEKAKDEVAEFLRGITTVYSKEIFPRGDKKNE
jgi:hypothetical protein